MGVQDYRCSVCGTPARYKCGEKTGGKCVQEGVGSDDAVLDLFFFAEDDAPESAADFEEARERARRVETQPYGYDWGEWDFVPTLNYRQLLMDDGDETGIWSIQPFDGDEGEGNPVTLKIPKGERVWVVNYCRPCRALFVDGETPAEAPCKEYLGHIAEQLELDFKPNKGASAAKAPFIEQVRARVARRLPATR